MTTLTWTTHQLAVPGATLQYEVAGSGPVLTFVGHPMGAADFRDLAAHFTGDHTVVLTDPRGFGASPLDNPDDDADPGRLADDLSAILTAVTDQPADVFGSSGGAVTALAFAARHPDQLRTVVAHEPPLVSALPDVDQQARRVRRIVDLLHEQGPGAAFDEFFAMAGMVPPPPDDPSAGPGDAAPAASPGTPSATPPGPGPDHEPEPEPQDQQPSEQQMRDGYRMLAHGLIPICLYTLEVDALRRLGGRLVIGAGQESGSQLARRCAEAVAARTGLPTTYFPGDHAPWVTVMGGDPAPFAQHLRHVLDRR